MKIGLIAGQGQLPHYVTKGSFVAGHQLCTVTLKGITKSIDFPAPSLNLGLAEFGAMVKFFRQEGCSHICLAGHVERPDFSKLKPDMKALKYFPGAVSAARKGDDALLTYLLSIFEKEGFEIISPQTLCDHLLISDGHMGDVRMTKSHRDDALKACDVARDIGAKDIGQAAVVCNGLVLAVEAQEGTDAMLMRVAELPLEKRGDSAARKGILAKLLKPGQDSRVDMPTIGPKTIELADKAGLAGIVVESGRAFCIDKPQTIEAADKAGLFIVGLPVLRTE